MIENTGHSCFVTDKWDYNGMQVVWMENEFLKIGILIGRGADVFEFRYKPQDINFLLRLPGDIKNPAKEFAQKRDSNSQMEDYYYGGWQDCLPNSAPFTYRGASYGQHGEVWGIPWEYSIIQNSPNCVEVKCWVRPMRTPLLIEKIFRLEENSQTLTVSSKVTNEGKTHFDLMWGQHIAFGLPFLDNEIVVEINADKIIAEPAMPEDRRFKPGIETQWPSAISKDGSEDDASIIKPAGQFPHSDLAYLSGFDNRGSYKIINQIKKVGFGLKWDAELFKYVWYWHERNGTQGAPWWGNVYTVALEPWTSKWSDDPQTAIDNGEWVKLEAHESIETKIEAFAIDIN